jgi:hypothetical protein
MCFAWSGTRTSADRRRPRNKRQRPAKFLAGRALLPQSPLSQQRFARGTAAGARGPHSTARTAAQRGRGRAPSSRPGVGWPCAPASRVLGQACVQRLCDCAPAWSGCTAAPRRASSSDRPATPARLAGMGLAGLASQPTADGEGWHGMAWRASERRRRDKAQRRSSTTATPTATRSRRSHTQSPSRPAAKRTSASHPGLRGALDVARNVASHAAISVIRLSLSRQRSTSQQRTATDTLASLDPLLTPIVLQAPRLHTLSLVV